MTTAGSRIASQFSSLLLLALATVGLLSPLHAQEEDTPSPSPTDAQAAATPEPTPPPASDESVADRKQEQVVAEGRRRAKEEATSESAKPEDVDLTPAPDQRALPGNDNAAPATGHEQSSTQRRLRYQIGLTLRTVYDDNINISKFDRQSDLYTTIEPTINVGFGDPDNNFLALTYSPSAFIFISHSENDTLQHIISLAGQYRFPQITVNLSEEIQILDGTGLNSATGTGTDFTRTNLDVSGRTRLNVYSTRVDANYSLTGKTFLTADLSYSLSDYSTLLSSSVISGNVYANYIYSPKLSIGLGATGGYDTSESRNDNQTFEQINVRASYELTGKVSASISAGFEFRQTEGGGSDNGSPVFDGTILYQPFDGTSVSLLLSRRTENSATLAGQDFHSTQATLSIRQRLLQRFFVGLSIGYENSTYFTTGAGFDSNRSDDYFFAQGSIDFNITNFWTAGVFYFYRESSSSFDLFSFYDNQIGFRTSFTF
ncbi:MAG: outer membrane beta-barrel protein [Chthoniobacterales bacterium]|nr:outer membrane beta-barrel protein [Chthoniobacterales bacterium]